MTMATSVSVAPQPTIRLQSWGDDLRLPSFTHAAASETAPLLQEIAAHRKTTQPFQRRHLDALKRNQWFALRRPACRSRTGLLVLWPAKSCCVFVAPEMPQRKPAPRPPASGLALLRIRVDPQFFAPGTGLTVFAATLSASSRNLWIEDVLLWKGRNVTHTESFTARWRLAVQWLEHYCIVDTKLLGGLRLEMARWQSLDVVKPEGVWEFMADTPGSPRLLWLPRNSDRTPTLGPEPMSSAMTAALEDDRIQLVSDVPVAAVPAAAPTGPLIAVGTRETGGPELWNLASADGVSLGRALIRRMTVSTALRTASNKTQRVEVSWNATFKKWEVLGLAEGAATVSHSSLFVVLSN
jgi:hypothetical protein